MATKKTPNHVDVHVGARVRMARNLCGMSQEALGGKLGITFQQVQKYEKGTNRIGSSRMVAIAKALGQKIAFFYEGLEESDGNENEVLTAMKAFSTPHGSRLLRTFLAANETEQQHIANIARTLVNPASASAK